MINVYVTCKNENEAKKIADMLLRKRLIACANIFPIKSAYRWKGKIKNENEIAVLLKTINKNFSIIQREIEKISSYEIPCIEKIDVKANKKYEDWVNREVR